MRRADREFGDGGQQECGADDEPAEIHDEEQKRPERCGHSGESAELIGV